MLWVLVVWVVLSVPVSLLVGSMCRLSETEEIDHIREEAPVG